MCLGLIYGLLSLKMSSSPAENVGHLYWQNLYRYIGLTIGILETRNLTLNQINQYLLGIL